ncbi:MAG: hypothetical protein H7A49_15240 [Akkermansiaceae bacterium]|nr:hypothetical protein [Akkermansiaceae bacterium]
MKPVIRLTLLIAATFLISACGPDEAQLRAELNGIEQEMLVLRTAAYQHQSAMDKAQFDAFISGFATTYGAMDGDYELAGQGVGGAIDAVNRADVAGYTLDQIQQRYNVLAQRREEILRSLQ